MQPVFCFIDDSRFELDLFAAHIVPAAPQITFILDTTYQNVFRRLEGRYPCLFLLDLYGKTDDSSPSEIPLQADLMARIQKFPDLSWVYDGLDQFPGDRTNEFLKRLFQITDAWRSLFFDASRDVGQDTGYGLGNLASVRRDFPGAAAAGYTRKSLITDAVDAFRAGVDGLFLKPNGPGDQAIKRATVQKAPGLIQEWSGLVDKRFETMIQKISLGLARGGMEQDLKHLPETNRLSLAARQALGPETLLLLGEIALWRRCTDLGI